MRKNGRGKDVIKLYTCAWHYSNGEPVDIMLSFYHKGVLCHASKEDALVILDTLRPLPKRWAIFTSLDNKEVERWEDMSTAMSRKAVLTQENPEIGYYVKDLLA